MDIPQYPVLENIMNEYGDSLLRMCFLYLKDIHLAEDAVQDTLIRVYKGYRGFNGKSSEKTWVVRIAINVCKSYMKSSWYHNQLPSAILEDIPAKEYEFQDDLLITNIIKLSPKYKEVILLYYYQELKIKEISKILHIPESTVAVRLKRAREQLKIKLESEAEFS